MLTYWFSVSHVDWSAFLFNIMTIIIQVGWLVGWCIGLKVGRSYGRQNNIQRR